MLHAPVHIYVHLCAGVLAAGATACGHHAIRQGPHTPHCTLCAYITANPRAHLQVSWLLALLRVGTGPSSPHLAALSALLTAYEGQRAHAAALEAAGERLALAVEDAMDRWEGTTAAPHLHMSGSGTAHTARERHCGTGIALFRSSCFTLPAHQGDVRREAAVSCSSRLGTTYMYGTEYYCCAVLSFLVLPGRATYAEKQLEAVHATLRSAGHDVSDLTVYAKELEKEVARLKARVSAVQAATLGVFFVHSDSGLPGNWYGMCPDLRTLATISSFLLHRLTPWPHCPCYDRTRC